MKKLLCAVVAIFEMYRVESMEVWSDVYAPRLIARSDFTKIRQDSLKVLDFIKEEDIIEAAKWELKKGRYNQYIMVSI